MTRINKKPLTAIIKKIKTINIKNMSFQAYIDNIKAKTGKTPDDFKKIAEEKEFIIDGKLNPK